MDAGKSEPAGPAAPPQPAAVAVASPGAAGREPGTPKRTLSVADAIAVVVGIVIGAGIFAMPPMVAQNVPNAGAYLLVWLAGGAISLIGALCYAELATTYPDAGGEYHFLSRGLGSGPAFLFAWARLTVIQTGSIAIHAFIIGDYIAALLFGPSASGGGGAVVSAVVAVLTVVVLTALNVMGLRQGKGTQKILTGCVVTAVLLVCAVGLSSPAVAAAHAPAAAAPGTGGWWIGAAMVFVLLTYGGWNEAAYLSAEVRGGRRGIVKVLIGGIALVTAVYLLINIAYLRGLGLAGIAKSEAVAADLLRGRLGEAAAAIVTLIVVVAALGNMNATILTGARTSYALGRDYPMFSVLGRWRGGREAPVVALLVQGAMTLALVIFGSLQRNGLEAMVKYTTPVFWLFFLLTGISLIILRFRDRAAERPFRVPLFPVTPVLFCIVCAYMLYAGIEYAGHTEALLGLVVLALGVPLMIIAKPATRWARGPAPPRGFESVMADGTGKPAAAVGDNA
jgi:amino acid transporter